MTSNTPSTWSGRKLPRAIASPRGPALRPKTSPALLAATEIAGNAPRLGKTATASRQRSGPQTSNASGEAPSAAL
eukprot:11160824-Lingulodinium_polyedra.AAC.1